MIGLAAALSLVTGKDYIRVPASFGSILTEATPFTPEQGVVVSAKKFTADESKYLLGHDLISRGVVPIQVDVQNNTPNEYSLCASSVDLPHVDPSKVAFQVSKSAIPRAVGWKVLSLFFWPLMVPSTIDGIRTYAHHRELKRDFHAKSLKEQGEVISPYSTYHRILFVPEESVKEAFVVTVIDLETLEQTAVKTELTQSTT